MPYALERLEEVASYPLATSLTPRFPETDVARVAVGVPVVDHVRRGERAFLALGERLWVDERVTTVGAKEVQGVVGSDWNGRGEGRVRDGEVLLICDRRLALEASRGVELSFSGVRT